jgi:cell division protein FtsQ
MARNKRGASRTLATIEREPIQWSELFRQFSVMAALVISIGGIVLLFNEETLPILHVSVDGEFDHVNKQRFIDEVTPHVTGSFLSVDVASIRQAGEALPWVKQIQVNRVWPDSLLFIVEEHDAVAQWGQQGLISEDGQLFYPDKSTFPLGLPLLQGPDSRYADVTERYQYMNTALAKQRLAIKKLVMDERHSWSMTLSNDIEVQLGRLESEERFERFISAYQTSLKQYQGEIAIMDMRYTNGLSVQWKHDQQPEFNGTV